MMDQFLSKYQCGFRKGLSAQDCSLAMSEKWKRTADKENLFGVLKDSKAFYW